MYGHQIKKRQPFALQALNILRKMILEGDFKPGERLIESDLSMKLGINRAPIREALKVLEAEDLIVNFKQKGTFVKELSATRVKEIYEVMEPIHSLAVRSAIERMDAKMERELRSLEQRQEKFSQTGDIKKTTEIASEFHRFIIVAAGNEMLTRIYDLCLVQEARYRFIIVEQHGIPKDGINEHTEIIEAILKRDTDKAEALIMAHFKNSCQRALRALESRASKLAAVENEGAKSRKPEL